jgi:hypothetical protein
MEVQMHRVVLASGLALLLSACGSGSEASPDPESEGRPLAAETAAGPSGESSNAPQLVAPVEAAAASEPSPEPAASLKPRIPLFNATCGVGIEVHANEGGPVFIDGEETSLKKFNDNYFEASRDGTTISISFRPDGSLNLGFSGPNRANGICTLK